MVRRRIENMQVIVCGPNRSGTSLMMRCLEMAGFKMAEDLQLGDGGNMYGYYESKRFKALCREQKVGSMTLDELRAGIRTGRDHKPNVEKLRKLLDKKGNWAWKYPFAVFMLDTIFEAAENMFVIYMVRPKADVINSWLRQCEINDTTPYPVGLYSLWYDITLEAIEAYRHKKIKVDFLDLVENEKMVMNEILDILGLETNYDCTAVDIREVHFKD